MDLHFDELAHAYTLDGRRVPSVTQVLDKLQLWDGISPEDLEAARVFGTHVHMACHLFNLGSLDTDDIDPLVASYVRGYAKFLEDTNFIVLASEERLASHRYGYAGTLDVRGLLPKPKSRLRTIIDLKSTASLPRTVGPQTAAYERAHFEMSGEKTDRRYCLLLKPDGYSLQLLADRGDFDVVFLSALNLWRWWNT